MNQARPSPGADPVRPTHSDDSPYGRDEPRDHGRSELGDHGRSELGDHGRYELGDFASFGDADDPADVDAAFRSQRRIAAGYFAVFLVVTLGAGLSLVALDWASEAELLGGFTPGFAVAAFGLYVFFVVIGTASSSLANGVEEKMMGAQPPSSDRSVR